MKAFHPCARTSTSWEGFFLCALLLLSSIQEGASTIEAGNSSIPSLPGLFGRTMAVGHLYKARLQFLRENPYLCDDFDPNKTSFVPPIPTLLPGNAANFTFVDPIVLIAARGECPFERKAKVAAQLGDVVEFLIVYNFNVDGEDAIVPMYSEYGTSKLVLLSVTHRGGQELKEYIAEQDVDVLEQGGPIVYLDSVPPEGILSIEDLQNMLLSALGLFFMLISASSCLMICAGTHGYVITTDGRLVLMRQAQPGTSVMGSGLLTEEQVRQVSHHASMQVQVQADADETSTPAAAAAASATRTDSNDEQPCCAVCIDDFAPDADIIVLPCRHKFHTDCIVPWLTERQSKCPLCKFDVMGYCQEMEAEQHAQHANAPTGPEQQQHDLLRGSALRGLSDRILRYRWTRVRGEDMPPDRDGVALAPNEMDVDSSEHELELTEQHLT
jgi:hypothetical protein